MDDYQKTFKAWNSIAIDYEKQFMDIDIYNSSIDYFKNSLRTSKAEVLEIGCGPGNITKFLSVNWPELNITAIDISANMIDIAKVHAPFVKFKLMDVRDLNLIEGVFDGIICGFTLPYLSIRDREKMIQDCSKLLQTNGILYLSYVHGIDDKSQLFEDENGNTMRFYYHDNTKVKADLKAFSLVAIKEFSIPYNKKDGTLENHAVIIAKKT